MIQHPIDPHGQLPDQPVFVAHESNDLGYDAEAKPALLCRVAERSPLQNAFSPMLNAEG